MDTNIEELRKRIEDIKTDRESAKDFIVDADQRIEELTNKLEELDKLEDFKRKVGESAKQLKIIHSSFIDAGFTSDQAFSFILTVLQASLNATQAPSDEILLKALLNAI